MFVVFDCFVCACFPSIFGVFFKKHEKEQPKHLSQNCFWKLLSKIYGKRILTLRNPNSLAVKLLLVNITATPQNTVTSERPQVTLVQGQLSDKTTNAFDATGPSARNSSKGSILLGNFLRRHISPHP